MTVHLTLDSGIQVDATFAEGSTTITCRPAVGDSKVGSVTFPTEALPAIFEAAIRDGAISLSGQEVVR